MTLPVIVRPEAEADLRMAHDDLEAIQKGLGQRFSGQVRIVFERIEAMPELYGVVWSDFRAARVRRFRYLVYYFIYTDRIEIVAVMHGARDPMAWQSRG